MSNSILKEYTIKPIGIVKSKLNKAILKYSNRDIKLDLDVKENHTNDVKTSQIIINEEYIDCLDGIEEFSHIIIIFWTNEVPEEARQIKKVHPAGLMEMPLKGIFATRSPVRPNPICKTTVRLVEKKGSILFVEGLDAINDTPVIDIKPHLTFSDSPINVKLADWMYDLMDRLNKMRINNGLNDSTHQESSDIRAHPCINTN